MPIVAKSEIESVAPGNVHRRSTPHTSTSCAARYGARPGADEAGTPSVGAKFVTKLAKSPCSSIAAWCVGFGRYGASSRTTRCTRIAAFGPDPTLIRAT